MLHNRPQGIAVLLALIIISVVTLIGLGIAAVINREIGLSKDIDYSLQAYYASDSGVERGLYRVQDAKNSNNNDLNAIVAEINGYAATFSSTLSNGAKYGNATTALSGSISQDSLLENQSVQADYSVRSSIPGCNLAGGACVESWIFGWNTPDPTSLASIEVTIVGWTPSSGSSITFPDQTIKKIIDSPYINANSQYIINGIGPDSDPVPTKFYRIRVKALGGNLTHVTVTGYTDIDGGGTLVPSSASINIKGDGDRQGFAQSISATIPWQTSLPGIFDYVVFSEQDLIKNVAVTTNPPIYRSGTLEFENGVGLQQCTCISPVESGFVACGSTAWTGGCVGNGATPAQQVARCNENLPAPQNMCSIFELPWTTSAGAGFFVKPNISSLNLPAGLYYLRVQGVYDTTSSLVNLAEEGPTPGSTQSKESITFPTLTTPGLCKFNCLFRYPVRLGQLCAGGTDDGKACTGAGDCHGSGATCKDYQNIYLLSGNGNSTTKKTYFDWYSLSSSPLLTGPSDKYCIDFKASDCLP